MMKQLTETEKQYIESHFNSLEKLFPGMPPYTSSERLNDLTEIRNRMKENAYHEAGHFAAHCFTGRELSHITSITIIPTMKWGGCIRFERIYSRYALKSYPPPWKRVTGNMMMIELFAGLGATMIMDTSENWDSIYEYNENMCIDDGYEETTDMYRAQRVADIMAKPYMPAHRILRQADKWTMEMLRLPFIWKVVEEVAGILVEHGTIPNKKYSMNDLIDPLRGLLPWCRIPKWTRRFSTEH